MSEQTNKRASQLNLDHLEQAGQLASGFSDHLQIAVAAARVAEANKCTITTFINKPTEGGYRQLETVEAIPTPK